jgi:hypothetical protein
VPSETAWAPATTTYVSNSVAETGNPRGSVMEHLRWSEAVTPAMSALPRLTRPLPDRGSRDDSAGSGCACRHDGRSRHRRRRRSRVSPRAGNNCLLSRCKRSGQSGIPRRPRPNCPERTDLALSSPRSVASPMSPIRHSGRQTVRAQLRRQRPRNGDRAGDERNARIGIVRTAGVRRVLRRESGGRGHLSPRLPQIPA